MPNRLYGKLAIAAMLLFIILGFALLEINKRTVELFALETTQRVNRDIALHAAEDMPLLSEQGVNEAALKELAHHVMLINPIVEVYLLSAEGEVLSHALPKGTVELDRVDLAPIKRFLSGNDPLPIVGDDPRAPVEQKVFSVSPIVSDGVTSGYLYTILNGRSFQKAQRSTADSHQLTIGRWTIGASVLLAIVAGLILFFLLTRRLTDLAKKVRLYRQGGFKGQIDVPASARAASSNKKGDEITELHSAISAMSERIESQFNAIEHADKTRRDLVANVSHDLRTPLSSMQGYLELAISKQDEASKPELIEYVKTAHKHSRRLNSLVGDLFELAKLESQGLDLNCEVFSPLELMHDLVQEYQLEADKNGVRLSVSADSNASLANADIALVHRALENLVSNALKNTPANGEVLITAFAEEETVRIEVVDDGTGIAEESMPFIFDRFYTRQSARPEEGHGLGLAIVKRIMDLHQSHVTAKNGPHGGAVFSFWLPRAQALPG